MEREEVQHFIIKDLFGSFRPEKRKFSRCVQGEFFIPSRDIKQRAVFQPHVFPFVLLTICLISCATISYITLLASSSVQIKMIISTNIYLRKKNNFQFINERDATIDTFNKILLQEFVINTMSSWFNENTWLIFLNSQHVSFLILTTIIFIPFFPFYI